jgi:hypothetical protein
MWEAIRHDYADGRTWLRNRAGFVRICTPIAENSWHQPRFTAHPKNTGRRTTP